MYQCADRVEFVIKMLTSITEIGRCPSYSYISPLGNIVFREKTELILAAGAHYRKSPYLILNAGVSIKLLSHKLQYVVIGIVKPYFDDVHATWVAIQIQLKGLCAFRRYGVIYGHQLMPQYIVHINS